LENGTGGVWMKFELCELNDVLEVSHHLKRWWFLLDDDKPVFGMQL